MVTFLAKPGTYLWAVLVFSLVAIAFFVDVQTAVVAGGSMYPAYDEGDRVLVDTFVWRVTGLRAGDVVVFDNPTGRATLDIKRVSDRPAERGTYYLLGDNSANSTDSRSWGSVPADYIRGRVLLKL